MSFGNLSSDVAYILNGIIMKPYQANKNVKSGFVELISFVSPVCIVCYYMCVTHCLSLNVGLRSY